jgi:prephenate dehydrogenase
VRIAVIGVGLIGGSIALAARERLGAYVAGFDRDADALALAVERGLIDRACSSAGEALSGSQAAFVAVPVGALKKSVGDVLEAAAPDCVVTDVGSTKRAVVAAFGADPSFVGGHPLAGTEYSGAAYARADLFEGATWYLTPTAAASPELCARLRDLIGRLGAAVEAISAEDHDRLMASVSHLPHVLANALVLEAAAAVRAARRPPPSRSPSLRDGTRVAGAPSAIWTDIYLQNRDLLGPALERTIASLTSLREALMAGERARVTAFNDAAASARRGLFSA